MNLLEQIELSIGLGIGQIFAIAFCGYVVVMAICLIAIWFEMLKAKLEKRKCKWDKPLQ